MPTRDILNWMTKCPPHHVEPIVAQLAQLSRSQVVHPELTDSPVDLSGIRIDDECKVTIDDDINLSAALTTLSKTKQIEPAATYFLAKLCLSREQFPNWPLTPLPLHERPWPFISGRVRRRIDSKLQTKTTYKPLQLNSVRKQHIFRCLKGIGWSLMPFTWRVDCADGRQYKLLKASKENQAVMDELVASAHSLDSVSFSPAVVDVGDEYLLVEYRNGRKVNFKTPEFAAKLGHSLGTLHKLDAGHLTRAQIVLMAQCYLSEIELYRPRIQNITDHAREKLWEIAPDTALTGTVYADLKQDNFLFDDNAELFMLDVGSYQRGQIIDIFLVGSSLFDNMPSVEFKKAYLAAGMSPEIFEHNTYFAILNAIKLAAFFLRVLNRFSVLDWRNRRNYNNWADEKLGLLQTLLESS